jgi:phosphoglucosamine mutase
MCEAVRSLGADVGLAFDGDGDRVMMCDERGEIVNGDHMLAICSTGMRTRGELNADIVVTTIMSNAGLEVALENRGIRMVRTDVGDKYVAEEMERSGASLGGEQSGHILFPRLSVTGDGMLTGLQVLAEMQRTQMRLSDLAGVVEPFPQRLVGLKVRDKTSWQTDSDLQETIAEYRGQFGKPEWLSVRASGTEPLLRIMAQDKNETFVEKTIAHLSVMIQDRYGVAST